MFLFVQQASLKPLRLVALIMAVGASLSSDKWELVEACVHGMCTR